MKSIVLTEMERFDKKCLKIAKERDQLNIHAQEAIEEGVQKQLQ